MGILASKIHEEKGVVLFYSISLILISSVTIAATLIAASNSIKFVQRHEDETRFYYLAESGIGAAIWTINRGFLKEPEDNIIFYPVGVRVHIERDKSNSYIIESRAETERLNVQYNGRITEWR